MQTQVDSKGQIALEWMTSHYGPAATILSRKYHFTFPFDSALCKWGEFFTRNYILWQLPHSGIIFDSQAITAHSAFVHKIWTASIPNTSTYVHIHMPTAKSSKWWHCAPRSFEPEINRLRPTVKDYCAKIQVIPMRGLLF